MRCVLLSSGLASAMCKTEIVLLSLIEVYEREVLGGKVMQDNIWILLEAKACSICIRKSFELPLRHHFK